MLISTLIYPLHLWAVNLAVGMPLLCLWLEWVAGDDEATNLLIRRLARVAWIALLVGSLLGGLHLAIIWDPSWSAKAGFATSRILFGVVELLTSLLLLVAYDLWLGRQRSSSRAVFFLRWLLPLIAGTNLLYHFPVLFGVLKQIDTRAIDGKARMTSRAFRELLMSGEVIANWMHFLLACLAVSGAVAIWLALADERRQGTRLASSRLRRLAVISAAGTLGQWIVGPLVFSFEKRHVQWSLSGGDWLVTGWFLQTMLLALLLSLLQLRLIQRPRSQSLSGHLVILQLAIIFSMCLIRLLFSG